jgi:hypothetical protein
MRPAGVRAGMNDHPENRTDVQIFRWETKEILNPKSQ